MLIALGTGGIKPCVAAFGGDQFVLPQQELQLAKFFSMFYFAINAGSLVSTLLTPILRENVHCFGEQSCYPLAFGIPGILMIVSICKFLNFILLIISINNFFMYCNLKKYVLYIFVLCTCIEVSENLYIDVRVAVPY